MPGTETAIVESGKWLWKTFGKDVAKRAGKKAGEKWKKFRYDKAERKYAEKVRRL